mmetsp:Transcript_35069/g.104855  ORF Transcript_35069/g.104855 Transcript_35069/m.104855 type:complete len:457 (+) Transcript_35069:41-1411(+)
MWKSCAYAQSQQDQIACARSGRYAGVAQACGTRCRARLTPQTPHTPEGLPGRVCGASRRTCKRNPASATGLAARAMPVPRRLARSLECPLLDADGLRSTPPPNRPRRSTPGGPVRRQVTNLDQAGARLRSGARPQRPVVQLLLLGLALPVLLLAARETQRSGVDAQQHERVCLPVANLQVPEPPLPADPPAAARRVRDGRPGPLDGDGRIEEVLLLALRDEALVEAAVQPGPPVEGGLAPELLVRVNLLVQHRLEYLALDGAVDGVRHVSSCSSGAVALDNLRPPKDKVPVLLHVLLANEVLRHEKPRELAATPRCYYKAAIAEEGIFPINRNCACNVVARMICDTDQIALVGVRTHVGHHALTAVLVHQQIEHWQGVLMAARKEFNNVEPAIVVGATRTTPASGPGLPRMVPPTGASLFANISPMLATGVSLPVARTAAGVAAPASSHGVLGAQQ